MKESDSIFAEALRLEQRGEAFALAFIIESSGSVPRQSGRMLIHSNGEAVGTIGGGAMEAQVLEEAVQAIHEGLSRTVKRRLTPKGEGAAGMECGGSMVVRIDVCAAPPRLLLVGGGHVNLAVARAAAPLGYAVEIAESREEFCTPERFPMARKLYYHPNLPEAITQAQPDENTAALIATHDDDLRSLSVLSTYECNFLGMLGSKRKVAVALERLRKEGKTIHARSGLRAPVGLDIGAQTPEEIAISVLAEILKVRSGRSGRALQAMSHDLVVLRGGGDLATGVAWRLHRAGFRVIILEIPQPTVIRRTVAFAEALLSRQTTVEGITARHAADIAEAYAILEEGEIPVLADANGESLTIFKPTAVVDAILAKRNLGTRKSMAPAVIALGPGFTAGEDCHALVETARGHELGRVILEGKAQPNSGIPGIIAGKGAERVLRAPANGIFQPQKKIGDLVKEGDVLAQVSGHNLLSPFDGKIRGLLAPDIPVTEGFKVGDVDPRGEQVNENLISDKARAVAGGVLEALLLLRGQQEGA